jgi:predicted amidophosphoribosyltransferase
MLREIKNFLTDVLFPKFCFSCKKEGEYLCEDCKSTLEVSSIHKNCRTENLKDLYFPFSSKNYLVERLIKNFKCEPFIKELSKDLACLITDHFQLIDNCPDFSGYVLSPVPLEKKELKRRGFNQSEELAKKLSLFLKIPLISCCPEESLRGKKILLVNDIYNTDSVMEKYAKRLKGLGAEEIIGIVLMRK